MDTGLSWVRDIEERAGRQVQAVPSNITLDRLERKGYLVSTMGNPIRSAVDGPSGSSE